MPRLTDEQLVELFWQEGSLIQLAHREELTPREIQRGWQRLKHAGTLPMARPLELWQDNREPEPGEQLSIKTGVDPLLTLLIKHHGPGSAGSTGGKT